MWTSYSLRKWRFSCSLNGRTDLPLPTPTSIILSIKPGTMFIFEHTVQSLLSTFVFCIHYEAKSNHTPLKCTCLIKTSNRIWQIYLTNTWVLDNYCPTSVMELSKSTIVIDLHISQRKRTNLSSDATQLPMTHMVVAISFWYVQYLLNCKLTLQIPKASAIPLLARPRIFFLGDSDM